MRPDESVQSECHAHGASDGGTATGKGGFRAVIVRRGSPLGAPLAGAYFFTWHVYTCTTLVHIIPCCVIRLVHGGSHLGGFFCPCRRLPRLTTHHLQSRLHSRHTCITTRHLRCHSNSSAPCCTAASSERSHQQSTTHTSNLIAQRILSRFFDPIAASLRTATTAFVDPERWVEL